MKHCVVLVLALAAACTQAPESPAAITLRVVFGPYLSSGPFFIAQDEGFFADEGLNVDLERIEVTADAIPALDRGEIDVLAGTAPAATFNAMARGSRLRIVAEKGSTVAECSYSALVVRRTLAEKGLPDDTRWLRGKRFALMRSTNQFGQWLDRLLSADSLSIDDLDLAYLGDDAVAAAFSAGTIDASQLSEPWLTRTLDAGHVVLWKKDTQMNPPTPYAYLFYGRRLLDTHPELGERFLAAYLRGVRQYREGKTARNVEIIAAHTRLPPELLQRVCWPGFAEDGRIDVEALVEFQRWLTKRRFLDAVITGEHFWEPRFVNYVARARLDQQAGVR